MPKAATKKATVTSTTDIQTKSLTIGKQLTLGTLIAELLGSAVLAFAALMSGNNPVIAAVALLVGALIFVEVSGGYLNPVVVVSAWVARQLTWVKAVGYIVVQLLGAMLAYVIVAKFMKDTSSLYTLFTKPNDPSVLQGAAAARDPGQWKPIFGELVGAIIFSFGAASALLNKKVGFERAFTIGGALLVGLVAALAGSYGVVNPAVAIALGGFSRGGVWSVLAYGVAPLVGGIVGAYAFQLMKQDADTARKK